MQFGLDRPPDTARALRLAGDLGVYLAAMRPPDGLTAMAPVVDEAVGILSAFASGVSLAGESNEARFKCALSRVGVIAADFERVRQNSGRAIWDCDPAALRSAIAEAEAARGIARERAIREVRALCDCVDGLPEGAVAALPDASEAEWALAAIHNGSDGIRPAFCARVAQGRQLAAERLIAAVDGWDEGEGVVELVATFRALKKRSRQAVSHSPDFNLKEWAL
jgi:hypothetical protein